MPAPGKRIAQSEHPPLRPAAAEAREEESHIQRPEVTGKWRSKC